MQHSRTTNCKEDTSQRVPPCSLTSSTSPLYWMMYVLMSFASALSYTTSPCTRIQTHSTQIGTSLPPRSQMASQTLRGLPSDSDGGKLSNPAIGLGLAHFAVRICPGRFFAEDSLCLTIASMLHIFTISHPESLSGNDALEGITWSSGLVRLVD